MFSAAGSLSASRGDGGGGAALARRRVLRIAIPADATVCLGVAATLSGVVFAAGGGTQLGRTTYTEIGLMLAGAAVVALALLRTGVAPLRGGWALAGLAALAILTGLSITWSLTPSDTWVETSRMLAYLAAFAGALGLVRLAPHRWAAAVGGVALGCTVVVVWALLTKVFPEALSTEETYARLRAPYDYWNALGLTAVLGVPPLMWLAAKRSGNLALNALAYPALGLAFVCLMLSYSRGALLALVLGVGFWLVVVPLRLRAATALACSAAMAALVVAWVFGQDSLTTDDVALAVRSETGHELGVLLLVATIVLLAVGLAVGFLAANRPPGLRTRRRAGRALMVVLLLIPVTGLLVLSGKSGGVNGQISKGWRQLTDPKASTPSNSPRRLMATASVRSRYWREAFDVFSAHAVVGAGAGSFPTARTRYRTGALEVRQAHGYVPELLSGLGLAGLAVSLGLLAAWLAAATRATGLRRRDRGLPMDAERVGLLTLTAVVVAFGVHSLVDWTWLVPGTAVIALGCAAWVAGRRPLRDRLAGPVELVRRRNGGGRRRALPAAAALLVAVAAAWAAFQPLRSVHAGNAAFDRLGRGQPAAALDIANLAIDRNPLSVDARFDLASIQDATGRTREAERTLQDAVELEPANAEAWRRLGEYRVAPLDEPRRALPPLRAAYYLDPASPDTAGALLFLRRALAAQEGG